tara:strand:+ start:647 stop:1477 length:831 start_codon:yes stop_codon:yes gene_type:complete
MKKYFLIFFFILLHSCSQKSEEVKTKVKGDSLETQMIQAYNAGVEALDMGDALFAAKKFNEAELLYPQSDWAPRSSLMASYAYFQFGYYSNSVDELERFINLYPKNKNLDYAYYLLAMNYYESIVDEKKDLKPLTEAKKYFNFIIKEYPDTDYALDGKYKLELIEDILAAKEIYIARYYIKKEKWIAAVNRLKFIVNNYGTTIFVEEALHRLVEIYYILGLEGEARKYAKTLGYNYQSGEWYKQSYKIFNKDYSFNIKKKNKETDKKLLDKIKSFF